MHPKTDLASLVILMTVLGCDPGHETSVTETSVIMMNGYDFRSFSFDPSAANGITSNGAALASSPVASLVVNGPGGVLIGGHTLNAEQDHAFTYMFNYLVECALDPDQTAELTSSTGTVYSVVGEHGLGPEWATGPLSSLGQAWVTACLAARSNSSGAHVGVSVRGSRIPVSTAETQAYPVVEGAFWGSAFGGTAADVFTCSVHPSTAPGRDCASGPGCGFTYVGDCAGVCTISPGSLYFGECGGEIEVVTTWLRCRDADFTSVNSSSTGCDADQ